MSDIILPGYSTLHPNQAFYKQSSQCYSEESGDMVVDLALLSKFNYPSKESFLESLKMYSRQVLEKKKEEYNMIERAISAMSAERLEEYAKDDSPARDILRNYIPISSLIEGEWYLHMHTVALPLNMILKEKTPKQNEDYIDLCLRVANMADEDINIVQMHLPQGNLPGQKELESILDMRVRDSSAFGTSFGYNAYDDAKDLANATYAGLNTEGALGLVRDKTDALIQDVLLTALGELNMSDMSRSQRNLLSMLSNQDTMDMIGQEPTLSKYKIN